MKYNLSFIITAGLIWLLCGHFSNLAVAQDVDYAHKMINKLAGPSMYGRGYEFHGDRIAADFLSEEFRKAGLVSLTDNYFQPFTFPMNTFERQIVVKADQNTLVPGDEYLVARSSCQTEGTFPMVMLLNDSLAHSGRLEELLSQDLKKKVIVTDKYHRELRNMEKVKCAGMVFVGGEKICWGASDGNKVKKHFVIDVTENAIPIDADSLYVDINPRFHRKHRTQNVVGMIPGLSQPDSFLVFTAHYDHLGMMGDSLCFPGANDNASGTAMLLDLARYFSMPENQPAMSMMFILFAGEEAGLLGSLYYTEHPIIPLQQIRFLINLDMVGTGSDGITVVNGKIYPEIVNMVQINTEKQYLAQVKMRDVSNNSDHAPFYLHGVPAVFIYTRGKEHLEYHNPADKANVLPLTKYEGLFRLLTDFVSTF